MSEPLVDLEVIFGIMESAIQNKDLEYTSSLNYAIGRPILEPLVINFIEFTKNLYNLKDKIEGIKK